MVGLLPPGHARSLVLLAATAWLGAAPTVTAVTAAPVTRTESHTAGALAVDHLVGDLRIEGRDRDDIQVVLEGAADDLAAFAIGVRSDTLHVESGGVGGIAGGVGRSVVRADRVTVIARGGGTSTVRMGGWTLRASGNESKTVVHGRGVVEAGAPVTVTIEVPRGTAIAIDRLIGDLMVEGIDGRVDLDLIDGAARIDMVAGGRLAVFGDAQIEIARAAADLDVNVRGKGTVRVAAARLDRLAIVSRGAGDVQVDGSAAQAVVDATGAGRIRIERVETRPEIRLRGRARVEIGNW